MTRFKLEPYKVRLKREGTEDYVPLSNIDGNGTDLLGIAETAIRQLAPSPLVERDLHKTLSMDSIEVQGREVRGILKSGEYGYGADFYNIRTSQLQRRMRQEEHSEVVPFFFLLSIPENSTTGILLLQTFQIYGIKSLLHEHLRTVQGLSDFTLEINPVISADVMEKLERSPVLEVSLIRHDVPRDIADRVAGGDDHKVVEKRTFKLRGERRISDWLKDRLSNRQTQYYEIRGERYEEVKIMIQDGDSTMTLTFGEDYSFREALLLDDCQEFDNGFPAYTYLVRKASDYRDRVRSLLEGTG